MAAKPDVAIKLKLDEAKIIFTRTVSEKAERGKRSGLRKFGTYVRQRAKRLLNKKGGTKVSKPGEPPRKITGLIRDNVFWFLEEMKDLVRIGPILINKPDGDVPGDLEHGATVERHLGIMIPSDSGDGPGFFEIGEIDSSFRARDARGRFKKSKARLIHSKRFKKGKYTIEPRPYMDPAFEYVAARHVPSLWEDLL